MGLADLHSITYFKVGIWDAFGPLFLTSGGKLTPILRTSGANHHLAQASFRSTRASATRQIMFANLICPTFRQRTLSKAGEHTSTASARARDIATLSRFNEYRNSICRGRSSAELVAIEYKT